MYRSPTIWHEVHTINALWRLPVVCMSGHMSISQTTEQISFKLVEEFDFFFFMFQ